MADNRRVDYHNCCGPLLAGAVHAATCEELMRSRYTAFVRGDADYLWRTWHPRTRPDLVVCDGPQWEGLEILDVVAGGGHDETGVVAFAARYRDSDGASVMRERSRFSRRGGRWMYLDGDLN